MSLERAALRLATVMALANGFMEPFPTMAGARVYDSRIDAVQITDEDEVLALITVNTDDDTGRSLSTNNGGPPFERSVTLSLDLHLGIPSKDSIDVLHMGTEADLELRLDLFESQVERLLTERPGVWGEQFDAIARRITDYSSVRFVERDGNVRLAARQIQMTVLLPLTRSMMAASEPAPGASLVPEPLGSLLDAIIGSGSPFTADAQAIQAEILASGAGSLTLLPPLKRIRLIEDERDSLNRRTNPRSQQPTPGVAQSSPDQI